MYNYERPWVDYVQYPLCDYDIEYTITVLDLALFEPEELVLTEDNEGTGPIPAFVILYRKGGDKFNPRL